MTFGSLVPDVSLLDSDAGRCPWFNDVTFCSELKKGESARMLALRLQEEPLVIGGERTRKSHWSLYHPPRGDARPTQQGQSPALERFPRLRRSSARKPCHQRPGPPARPIGSPAPPRLARRRVPLEGRGTGPSLGSARSTDAEA